MDIILDADALISDFTLTSPTFRLLFDGVSRLDAKLCIAEVSLDEAARTFREELSTLRTSADRLQRLSGRPLDLAGFACLDDLVSDYRARVAGRFTVLPTPPAVTHANVVGRILAERSPSRGGDRGYRNTLIWETVLERFAVHGGKVLLVTSDGGFSDKWGRPYEELLDDMDERGAQRDRLTIFRAVAILNRERVEPHLAAAENYEALLKQDALPNFSLRDWLLEEIPSRKLMWTGGGWTFRSSDSDVSVDRLRVDEISVTDVKGLGDDDIYVQAQATFYAEFRVPSSEAEYEGFLHCRDPLHRSWRPRERELRRDGNYVAFAELILHPDGEVVSADLFGADRLPGSPLWSDPD